MSKNKIEQGQAKALEALVGKHCSDVVNGKVNQRAPKLASGSTHTFEIQGITFTFADGTQVKIDNFWGKEVAALGQLLLLFHNYCKVFNSGCEHDMRTDFIQTI